MCAEHGGSLALLADDDRVSVCLLGSRMLEDVKLLIMPLGCTVVNSLTGLVTRRTLMSSSWAVEIIN